MKKSLITLILFALCSFTVNAQSTVAGGRWWKYQTLPPAKPVNVANTDLVLQLSDTTIYQWTSGGWVRSTYNVFKGSPGPAGPQGIPGLDGSSGGGSISTGRLKYVSNETELHAAVAGFGTGTTSAIYLTQDIPVDTSINIPKVINLRSKKPCIYLGGNALYDVSTSGLPYLVGRIPADQNEALNTMQDVSVIIRDGEFIGKAGTGVLLDLGSTYGSVVDAVDFSNANEGVHFRFCLMGAVSNSLAGGIRQKAYIADMGNWSGASNSNSQSNSSRFEQCRVFNYPGSVAAFADYAASGMVHEQCISEGGSPNYHFLSDALNSTVVKDGYLHMLHLESPATIAGIKLKLREGYYKLDGCYSQYDQTLIDGESTLGYPHIFVENVPFLTDNAKFKTNNNNVVWSFTEMPSNFDVMLSTNWIEARKPFYYYSEIFNQSKDIKTNGMKLNGKTIVTQ